MVNWQIFDVVKSDWSLIIEGKFRKNKSHRTVNMNLAVKKNQIKYEYETKSNSLGRKNKSHRTVNMNLYGSYEKNTNTKILFMK